MLSLTLAFSTGEVEGDLRPLRPRKRLPLLDGFFGGVGNFFPTIEDEFLLLFLSFLLLFFDVVVPSLSIFFLYESNALSALSTFFFTFFHNPNSCITSPETTGGDIVFSFFFFFSLLVMTTFVLLLLVLNDSNPSLLFNESCNPGALLLFSFLCSLGTILPSPLAFDFLFRGLFIVFVVNIFFDMLFSSIFIKVVAALLDEGRFVSFFVDGGLSLSLSVFLKNDEKKDVRLLGVCFLLSGGDGFFHSTASLSSCIDPLTSDGGVITFDVLFVLAVVEDP